MKIKNFDIDFLLLVVYIGWNVQSAMARHTHHHHRMTQPHGECGRCPPGFGVKHHCTTTKDTECGACAPDHYSAHHSSRRPCYPCSRCGEGLYVAHQCTAQRDTVCDSCHTYRGPHNEDFKLRCGSNATSVHEEKASESVVAINAGQSPLPPVVVAASLAFLVVFLLVACLLLSKRGRCRKSENSHTYEVVSTQEVII